MTLMRQRKDLETRYRIVCLNELLAKALIQKNDTANQPSSLGLQKEGMCVCYLGCKE